MKKSMVVGDPHSRLFLDAFPAPVFLIDHNLTIHDANQAANAFFGEEVQPDLAKLCGETLRCIHAINFPGQCSTTEHCPECMVLQTTERVIGGERSFRQIAKMDLKRGKKIEEICFLVSGAPLVYDDRSYIILILEDITELVELRKIVPICSYCRKIRDDANYWLQVEDYFSKYSKLKFSHGICPACSSSHFPIIDQED